MIRFDSRFDAYAYRVATFALGVTTEFYEGGWLELEGDKLVVATGDKKSYLCLTSKHSKRDNVTPQGSGPKASVLHGAFLVTVGNDADSTADTAFDSEETYTQGTPLKVVNGILAPWVAPTLTAEATVGTGETAVTGKMILAANDFNVPIVAYVVTPPTTGGTEMTIASA